MAEGLQLMIWDFFGGDKNILKLDGAKKCSVRNREVNNGKGHSSVSPQGQGRPLCSPKLGYEMSRGSPASSSWNLPGSRPHRCVHHAICAYFLCFCLEQFIVRHPVGTTELTK